MEDMAKIDVYELLGISINADEKEIKKAYRKKSLTCHPDKNPDPKAAEQFLQLTRALQLLTDTAAKAAYDKILDARKKSQIRNRELDSKRKKFKEDLEAKERAASKNQSDDLRCSEKELKERIKMLSKETERLIEEEMNRIRTELSELSTKITENLKKDGSQIFPKLKVKWKVPKGSSGNMYSESDLYSILGKHGHITCVAISKRKRGTAVVEFSTIESAKSAVSSQNESSDIKISWIGDAPAEADLPPSHDLPPLKVSPQPSPVDGSSTLTFKDYESVVLMKLRQANEREKLIQQMEEEEKTESVK